MIWLFDCQALDTEPDSEKLPNIQPEPYITRYPVDRY